MVVPTIAMYTSPPSSVCSAPYQTTTHSDFDLVSARAATSSASSSTASSHKPMVGGLSCLFSSRHPPSSFCGDREELVVCPSLRGEEVKEFKGCKFFGGASLKRDRHLSPVSVLQSQLSCSPSPSVSGSSSLRIGRGTGASGLFNGFVTHALGSCVAYDALPSGDGIDFGGGFGGGPEELTFNLEDGFVESGDHEPHVKSMLVDAQSRHYIFLDEFVVKAFYEAEKAHRGQMRASGDPYLMHCVETAMLLAKIGANSTVVAAGLLHDTLDDSFLSYDCIVKTFGAGVADLVKGVSELGHLSKLARDNDTATKDEEADRLHTMFLAVFDPRAVLIKLADRLHNMMTLDALPSNKQHKFAKETLEIFVPLTNRLGIFTWKVQLENFCFKHLNPDEHTELSSSLLEVYDEAVITSATEKLGKALNDEAVSYKDLYGRDKSLYSIHCKMSKKNLKMDEIHDIHGLRLIVENKEECYRALEVVHKLWSEVPGKFKDYISQPKSNGYQSLHTVVTREDAVPLEVQIRTEEMNSQAEFGFAAHWRYKEGDCQHSDYVLGMVKRLRRILWQCETRNKEGSSIKGGPPCAFPEHSFDLPFSYKPQSGQDGPVFVIMMENEKMTVEDFPANSTVMDLLERAGGVSRWSPYGFPVREELRLKLNHEPVSDLTCKLKMGDFVELIRAIPNESLMELIRAIPNESLTVYRREMQRMYNHGLTTVSGRS